MGGFMAPQETQSMSSRHALLFSLPDKACLSGTALSETVPRESRDPVSPVCQTVSDAFRPSGRGSGTSPEGFWPLPDASEVFLAPPRRLRLIAAHTACEHSSRLLPFCCALGFSDLSDLLERMPFSSDLTRCGILCPGGRIVFLGAILSQGA